MILNQEQQRAVNNGEPVEMAVGGTDCVLVRRDIYLRTVSTNGTSAIHKNGIAKQPDVEPNDEFDPEPPEWLDVEKDVYVRMPVPEILLEKRPLIVERGIPKIVLPEELPDD